MAEHQHVAVGDLRDQPGLLAARHEVVDEHADPAVARRSQPAERGGQVVDTVQHLDDDTLVAEVVAPDPLDERGVVDALDQDARRPGDAGPLTVRPTTDPDAVRVGCAGAPCPAAGPA